MDVIVGRLNLPKLMQRRFQQQRLRLLLDLRQMKIMLKSYTIFFNSNEINYIRLLYTGFQKNTIFVLVLPYQISFLTYDNLTFFLN